MEAYKIEKGRLIIIEGEEPFDCNKSLVSLKAIRISYEDRYKEIKFRVTYRNEDGDKICVTVGVDSHNFASIILDAPEMSKILFEWIEIEVLVDFSFTLLAALNVNLNIKLNNKVLPDGR